VSGVDLGLCDFDLTHLVIAGKTRINDLHSLSLLKECQESVGKDLGLREGDLYKSAVLGIEKVLTHVLKFQIVRDTRADKFIYTDRFGVEDFGLKVDVKVAIKTTIV
jgi:hypothetical protein